MRYQRLVLVLLVVTTVSCGSCGLPGILGRGDGKPDDDGGESPAEATSMLDEDVSLRRSVPDQARHAADYGGHAPAPGCGLLERPTIRTIACTGRLIAAGEGHVRITERDLNGHKKHKRHKKRDLGCQVRVHAERHRQSVPLISDPFVNSVPFVANR